jgi:NAD(P)-dependent dehydrogenase (short-subunit alcohol dehydrogenase family)
MIPRHERSNRSQYKAPFCSIYAASKHGVLGFSRSIADHYYVHDRIRVNCICPSTVKTNLMDEQGWSAFPNEYFTPLSKIAEVVLMLIDGGNWVDSKGNKISKGQDFGRAVEISQTNHYFRDQVPFSDDVLKTVMDATNVAEDETQDARFIK